MKRRGVTTVMAIVVLGLLATVLASTTATIVAEQRRVRMATAEAQASQLLSAAAAIARQQVADGKRTDGPVDSPVGRITLAWAGERCGVELACDGVGRSVTFVFEAGKLTKVE